MSDIQDMLDRAADRAPAMKQLAAFAREHDCVDYANVVFPNDGPAAIRVVDIDGDTIVTCDIDKLREWLGH